MRAPNGRDAAAGDAFWRFSLALYARPGVADALIALQDRAGRDVNLMLYALWLGVRGVRLDAAALAAAAAVVAPINVGMVGPLRRLRRQLRDADDRDLASLRRRVAGLELAAERRVQARLAASLSVPSCAQPGGDRLELAEANLARYLGDDAGLPEARVLPRALAALIRADAPDVERH